MHIRLADAADADFIERMLLLAFDWNGASRITLQALRDDPAVAHYCEGWPREGDLGTIAVDETDTAVGAAWIRLLPEHDPGYGFVDAEVPELSMGVSPDARGRGGGRALLTSLIDEARQRNIRAISLSVEDGNIARHLYESLGFVAVGRNGDSDTLLLSLA